LRLGRVLTGFVGGLGVGQRQGTEVSRLSMPRRKRKRYLEDFWARERGDRFTCFGRAGRPGV